MSESTTSTATTRESQTVSSKNVVYSAAPARGTVTVVVPRAPSKRA